ncbi:MAG: response regulator [Cyanobacteria bacterium P01_D01_bin.156]
MTESVIQTIQLDTICSPLKLLKTVKELLQVQINGYIHLKTSTGENWWLEFQGSQLLWAGGGQHRFRRWQRLLQTYCPSVNPREVKLREEEVFENWEYVALTVLLKRQQLKHSDALSIVEATLSEVLFDICHAVESITHISYSINRQARLNQSIVIFNHTTLFYNVKTALEEWQKTKLSCFSPNLAPAIIDVSRLEKQTQPRTGQILQRLLSGNRSLRELSRITGRDLCELGAMVAAYVERDIVGLTSINDLSQPYGAMEQKMLIQVAQKLPLIFCIDDSPQIGYLMEEVLCSAGYRCTSIQDSVQALAAIIRHTPDLIFLDVTMPVANGYEICKQVRRVKAFKQTPIIMLIGNNDSLMDRMRAKSVGATDFMVKPIDPAQVLETTRYQLASLSGNH